MKTISLGNNIASLGAQRRLGQTTNQLASVYERLSTGQRINRAVDDAAGLSIADSLKTDKRVLNQGLRNFNDGLSLLNIADSALSSLSDITVRLTELAEQAANGVLGHKQRQSLDEEAQSLRNEYTRIVLSTEFNERRLFANDFGELRLQGGYGLDGSILSSMGGAVGTGGFEAANNNISGLGTVYDVASGDLNGDGIPDIISAGVNAGKAVVAIQFGDGNGGFGSSNIRTLGTGTEASAVTLGDLNGDGVLDIAVAGNTIGQGAAWTLLGDGSGGFGGEQSYINHTANGQNIALEDLNGDGILDLATAGKSGLDAEVTIRFGQGDGTFGDSTSYARVGGNVPSQVVEFADLNGDGILDMVAGGSSGVRNVGQLQVRLGQGDGVFGAQTTYAAPTFQIEDLQLSDTNGDGILDIVSAGGAQYMINLGAGDGSFSAGIIYNAGVSGVSGLTLADLNGDGLTDLALGGSNGGVGSFEVLLGNGTGLFNSTGIFNNHSGASTTSVVANDLNGDGVYDIVASGFNGGPPTASFLGTTTTGTAPLLEFSLATMADARQALPMLQRKLEQLANQRGQIGATMSRLESGISNLQSTSLNIGSAESAIRSADIAQETSDLVRLEILQKASAAVLAQANQQSQLVLKLLA